MNYPFNDPDLSLNERVHDLISRLTVQEKINMLTTWQHGVPRLGIDDWHIGAEVARGYVSRNPELTTTVFPQPIGMAGMFDPDLMQRLGEIAGVEARIINQISPKSHLMLWGPTVDACRDPRWGRNEESYGEDPYLTGKMTAAYTKGMAGTDSKYLRTVPTLKHFYANNNEKKRASSSSNISVRLKNEYYHEFFRPAIEEGGARSMMAAYNCLSGVPGIVNPDIKTTVKDDWGLLFVVTDGGDFSQNVTAHHYSDSHAETLALALKAGTDIMTDGWELVSAAANEALSRGLITEADIDGSLYNSLRARFMLGEFDPKDNNPYSHTDPGLLDCDEHRRINRLAALEQTVLLENDGFLPLENPGKIAVIGQLAAKDYMDWYTGYSSYCITVLDGLKEKYGADNVLYDDGLDRVAIRSAGGKYITVGEDGVLYANAEKASDAAVFVRNDWGGEVTYLYEKTDKFFTAETMKADSDTTYRWFNQEILRPEAVPGGIRYVTYFKDSVLGIDSDGKIVKMPIKNPSAETTFEEEVVSSGAERAAALSSRCGTALLFCGNDPMIIARECYDRTTLSLPDQQKKLAGAVSKGCKNSVLTLISSYPYAIQDERGKFRAVIYTSHAGPEMGAAFAEVISGGFNPAGRLAQTWYRSEDELPSIFDYDIMKNHTTYLYYRGEPLYPFGYGLSYSEFSYSDLSVKSIKDGAKVSFKVENVSDRDGEEVAQLYFRMDNPRVERPVKQLCGFRRIKLKAHESTILTFDVGEKSLRFYDVTRDRFCVESGSYTFMAGGSSGSIKLSGSVRIRGERIPPRDLGKTVKAINYDGVLGSSMKFSKTQNRHYMSGGELTFTGSQFRGEKSIQLMCATSSRSGRLAVLCGDSVICEARIPACASETDFGYITLPIKPRRGVHDLKLRLDGITLLEFKLA